MSSSRSRLTDALETPTDVDLPELRLVSRRCMIAEAFSDDAAVPALAPDATPEAIRDALVGEERVGFERRYRSAMVEAADSLDLTGVLEVLRAYHRIAVQTQYRGAYVQQRLLDKARLITTGRRNPDAVSVEVHRARLKRRLDS